MGEDTSFHEENKDALLLNQDYHMEPDKELMSFQEKEVQHEKQKNNKSVVEETEIDNEEGDDLDMDRYLLPSQKSKDNNEGNNNASLEDRSSFFSDLRNLKVGSNLGSNLINIYQNVKENLKDGLLEGEPF